MVRATRSSVIHQKDLNDNDNLIHTSTPLPKLKHVGRKRKRSSIIELEDQPSLKHLRGETDDATPNDDAELSDSQHDLPFVGELSLSETDARKILDVLEMIDTQGLLDRIFPLQQSDLKQDSPSSPSTSKHTAATISLRTLLKEFQNYSLQVLRTAVNHLFPISSQPRSRASPPGLQQLQFCQLALSLLDQASRHNIDIDALDYDAVIQSQTEVDPCLSPVIDHQYHTPKPRRYALVQRLPGGDWWSSLNSESRGSIGDTNLTYLGTGHAELVSLIPPLSSSSKRPPTLGELHIGKKITTKAKPPGPRYVSSGSFLDYGPYTSFAPSFDSDGCEIGRMGMGDVLWAKHQKSQAREKARILRGRLLQKIADAESMDVDDVTEIEPPVPYSSEKGKERAFEDELSESLLTLEEVEAIRSTLDGLQQEKTIDELLVRCSKALVQLKNLQDERLSEENGGSSYVAQDSEEWETAQKIMNTFTMLLSVKPRTVNSKPALIPPSSVLRVLQRTLPIRAFEGWWGTLSGSRATALRDDNTLHIQSGVTTPTASVVGTPKAASATLPTNQQTSTPAYTAGQTYAQQNYAYANYPQSYRSAYQYTPGAATGNYYPNTYNANTTTPQGQATATQYSAHNYTPGTQTNAYAPYAGWFSSYQAPAAVNANAMSSTASGRGTPQPANTVSNYSYYPTQSTTRAVANTITVKPQQNGWSTSTPGYIPPTLPPHLRPGANGTPGSPLTPTTASSPTTQPVTQTASFGAPSLQNGHQTPIAGQSQ